ncbi:hypothetical protein [Duganella radicis]|uniref:KAP NTPase domain-containing protein n=1 Tax=Duganella radicis TaxID=551988 RepID=A0A6L6PRG0_9BURK|nr:hypothetical protein [Duganella radicis]MTV41670.1 hypothetical protein [Duganella radicis]
MSIDKTKENLKELIADEGNRVIALSGKWGTGKSYLWKSVQEDAGLDSVKDALYISLFGIRDISQLKVKLVQGALADPNGSGKIMQWINDSWQRWGKPLRALKANASDVIDELALLAVPKILNERFIVLDDIERKHDKLDISEVMGFIDEYTQKHKARFLLILNSDQLADKTMWDTLREKIIDYEVVLNTSPEEAFLIALEAHPCVYAPSVSDAVKKCSITNIRIIQKIIRAVNRLLANRGVLNDATLARVIPSTVLLGAIHYRGIPDGPDAKFVLSFNIDSHQQAKEFKGKMGADRTQRDRLEDQWALLMGRLNIPNCDEFEAVANSFFETGLIEEGKLKFVIDRYVAEAMADSTRQRVEDFIYKITWNPEISDHELLLQAEALIPEMHTMDPYYLTSVHATVSQLPEGKPVAERMIERWLENYREHETSRFEGDYILNRGLHPKIAEEFEADKARIYPALSLLDVCKRVEQKGNPEDRDEKTMKLSTPEQFENEIRALSGKDLQTFMMKNFEFYSNRERFAYPFGMAMENFVLACRTICKKNDDLKRANLIRHLFDRYASSSDLLDESGLPATPLEATRNRLKQH